MKPKHHISLSLIICVLILAACSEAQAGTPENAVPPTFSQITPEWIASNSDFTRYIRDVKQLHADCLNALHQWDGYATQAAENPSLYDDTAWLGYISGTVEWIDDTCGKFDKLGPPRMLIALHGQLAIAAQNYRDFTTAYVLGVNHLHDHPELLSDADKYLSAANEALGLAATKLP